MINKRYWTGFILMVCIAYGTFHLRCCRVAEVTFQADSLTRREKLSSHWLIINSKIELDEYVKDPLQSMSIILTDDVPCPYQWNKTKIKCLNIRSQKSLHLSSKNPILVAYLFAIERGARFIYEYHPNIFFAPDIQHLAFRRARSPFVSILPTFTANATLHSPGLPTDELKNISQDGWSSIRTIDRDQERIRPLIQQQIRLHEKNRTAFVDHPPVAIEPWTFAPFTNKNLLFAYDAFWGLVFSESKSKIWRSWWVQRLLWDIDGHLVFAASVHEAGVAVSDRPEENTKADGDVGQLVRFLSQWRSTKTSLAERIEELTAEMVGKGFCHADELRVIRTWLDDLKQINYVFPAVKNPPSEQVRKTSFTRSLSDR